MFDSDSLPIKKRVYSLVIVEEIGEHPNGVRFSDLRKTLRISKPCLAYTLLELKEQRFICQTGSGLYMLTANGRKYLERIGENLDARLRSLTQYLIRKTEDRMKTQIKDERLLYELENFFRQRIIEIVKEGADEISRRSALLLESLGKPEERNGRVLQNAKRYSVQREHQHD